METKKQDKKEVVSFNGKMPSVLELLQAGVHFGHQKGRWHPKMKDFIFTERGGIHVIDLEKTVVKLKEAADFAKGIAQNGGLVLFVGTKRQGYKIITKYAQEIGMPVIAERWIGGLFTNFANVSKLIKKYKDLKEQKESGAFEKYTKKEQVEFGKTIEKLSRLVGGLTGLTKIPSAVFVLDVKREKTAVVEAQSKGVKIIAFCDTNINPEPIEYPIPANDDAVKSIDIIVKTIAEAIKEGQLEAKNAKI